MTTFALFSLLTLVDAAILAGLLCVIFSERMKRRFWQFLLAAMLIAFGVNSLMFISEEAAGLQGVAVGMLLAAVLGPRFLRGSLGLLLLDTTVVMVVFVCIKITYIGAILFLQMTGE
ncbi:MAG: hypothetical protein IT428_08295 [Planctomycetaceae bacterium]|nr:hypothetical protein [Planctomycetaceae bacterium]